jgi:type IX secretion system PorP/SprF family membrane protein
MRKIILPFFVMLASYANSQNPIFSQYYTTGLYLNPALSGLEKDIFLGINYRSQWNNVNLPFTTFQLSAIHPVFRHRTQSKQLGSIAGSVFSDQAGPNNEFTTVGLSLAGAYNLYLDEGGYNTVVTGAQFGFHQKRVNGGALQWSSQYGDGSYDASLPGENGFQDRIAYPQVNLGIVWNHIPKKPSSSFKGIYHGFSVSNINKPKGFFDDHRDAAQILYRFHGAVVIEYNEALSFSPHYLLEFQQRAQLNFGANATYLLPPNRFVNQKDIRVSAGLWYRVEDSFIFTFGISNPQWSAGVSYDMNSSSFARNFNGASAFELSLSYRISKNKGYTKFSSPLM